MNLWFYVLENKRWVGFCEPVPGVFSVDVFYTETEADAKRIAYCVNAFSRIENPSEINVKELIEENRDMAKKILDLMGLLQNIDEVLQSDGTLTKKSVLRGGILLALGKDPNQIKE